MTVWFHDEGRFTKTIRSFTPVTAKSFGIYQTEFASPRQIPLSEAAVVVFLICIQ